MQIWWKITTKCSTAQNTRVIFFVTVSRCAKSHTWIRKRGFLLSTNYIWQLLKLIFSSGGNSTTGSIMLVCNYENIYIKSACRVWSYSIYFIMANLFDAILFMFASELSRNKQKIPKAWYQKMITSVDAGN